MTYPVTATLLKRSLIVVHRWLGVALCLLFLIWFPSAIGVMYWDFPSVTAADRLAHAPALNPEAVKLSPAEAAAKVVGAPPVTQIRLNTFDARPVYRFGSGRSETLVYADTGEVPGEIDADTMSRIASAWTGQPPAGARVESMSEVDQWTVQGGLRGLRGLWKYSWPDGQQVYISQASGEVVQYTTRASRLGAYLGPIPHWLYFTPLRKHPPQWSRFVIWTSGIGTVGAIVGMVVGIWIYSPKKRYRSDGTPTSIPYRGQKRWHTICGLIFGLGAVTWAFSGMLSMEPFPLARSDSDQRGREAGSSIARALRGRFQINQFDARHPADALRRLAPLEIKELELTTFASEPAYVAKLARGGTRVVPLSGELREAFDSEQVMAVVSTAVAPNGGADLHLLTHYDAYYLDRRRNRPLPVVLAQLHDAARTRYYIDPRIARIVETYSSRNWATRWAYHGLHSLDFPWLYAYRPLWDVVVITFMLGGTALSVTGVILAWRVVGRKLQGAKSS